MKSNMDIFKSIFKSKQLDKNDIQCTHDWKLIAKSYAPPRKDITNTSLASDVMQKALFGVTTLLQECVACHALRKEEMLGTDENQLQDILDKVKEFGMQYVRDGDKTYAIAQWVPDSGTPVR